MRLPLMRSGPRHRPPQHRPRRIEGIGHRHHIGLAHPHRQNPHPIARLQAPAHLFVGDGAHRQQGPERQRPDQGRHYRTFLARCLRHGRVLVGAATSTWPPRAVH
jgi:hypothetical protein